MCGNRLKLSVVIPVYNDPEGIQEVLESLWIQDFQGLEELVVVDDGSSAKTLYAVSGFREETGWGKIVVKSKLRNEGRACARNTGLELATGDFVLFTDSDCTFTDNALKKCLEKHREGFDVVYGDVKVANSDKFYPLVNKMSKRFNVEQRFGTPFMSIDRRKFLEMGGFREMRGYDVEVKKRIEKQGLKVYRALDGGFGVESVFPTDWSYIAGKKFLLGKTGVNIFSKNVENYSFKDFFDSFKIPGFYSVFLILLMIRMDLGEYSLLSNLVLLIIIGLFLVWWVVHVKWSAELLDESDSYMFFFLFLLYSIFAEGLQTLGFLTRFHVFVRSLGRWFYGFYG